MNAQRHKLAHAATLALAGFALSAGCMVSPMFADIRDEILRQIPEAEFEEGISLSFGPTLLGAVQLGLKLADSHEASMVGRYLAEIDRVELAVYEAKSKLKVDAVEMPRWIQRQMEKNGWEILAKVKDRHERVWIFHRTEGRRIVEMFVLVLDRRELVMVRASGRLDGLFQKAMEDHHGMTGLFTSR